MPYAISFFICVALLPPAMAGARRLRLVDRPTDATLKLHAEPVPVVGGLIAIGVAFAVAGASGIWLSWGFVTGILVALLVGMADDLRSLPVSTRVVALLAAGLAVWFGTDRLADAGGIGAVLTVISVVTLANSMNLIDGQDALAGGTSGVALAGFGILFSVEGHTSLASLMFVGACAIGGFLVWNRPQARVFLGNGGAYAIGVWLGSASAIYLIETDGAAWLPTLIILGVLLLELATTIVRRFRSGVALTSGDREHSYDLLSQRIGRTPSTIAFVATQLAAVALAVAVA